MNFQVEPPEKNKNSSPPSCPYIPDEIAVNCLARISRSNYPRLSIVSKSFGSILSSTELYVARSHLGNTEQCLYVCLCDYDSHFSQWFTLWINPNQTLTDSSVTKKTIGHLLVPISSSNVLSIIEPVKSTVAVVGSEIYVIGGLLDKAPSTAVRILDCRSHTWRDGPSMNVAYELVVSCVYDGKIYVMGGCKSLEVEVLDTKTQTWKCLRSPGFELHKPYICKIMENGGKIYFQNYVELYAYDPKHDTWDSCDDYSVCAKFECVVENVPYCYFTSAGNYGLYMLKWYDIKDGNWKKVNGLDSLTDKYKKKGELLSCQSVRKLVSFGDKLLLIWEGHMIHDPIDMKNIWCAEIKLEKRDGGEVWGNVEWADVICTVPESCQIVHCLAVSV